MGSGNIELKPIKELLGMNFFIPDYQRGYRWEKQQVKDLLTDIEVLVNKIKSSPNSSEIYCIQPLVVQRQAEKTCEQIKEIVLKSNTVQEIRDQLKEIWSVVDGQQRLTTVFLILQHLNQTDLYSIKYQTRDNCEDFLNNIVTDASEDNIDFFHIDYVREAISDWFSDKDEDFKRLFRDVLLDKVHFIWYQLSDDENSISVFTRLNIGKIPLTNSELIKALFLNRSNFQNLSADLVALQLEIANQWDEIETTLQNDEFWLFIHEKNYDKPTRIDYILDYIYEKDKFAQYKPVPKRGKAKNEAEEHNSKLKEKIGCDDYSTFRYFYELFSQKRVENQGNKIESYCEYDWLKAIWQEVKRYFEILNNWYTDYRLFHYVGYVLTENIKSLNLDILLTKYTESNREKDDFVDFIKSEIRNYFKGKEWFRNLKNQSFKSDVDNKNPDKTECRPLLLLHNIETIIQQNTKLVSESKYKLPNFNKFPFHLYKNENWQVEHIHPNAGVRLDTKDDKNLYLVLAQNALPPKSELYGKIANYLENPDSASFDDLYSEINLYGSPLLEEEKNKIFNFTLLDETTNKEYQNAIFPVKRAFLANKEQGYKIKFRLKENKKELDPDSERTDEIAFVPICTKNIFSKNYTMLPSSLMAWTKEDAEGYLSDMMEDKLYYYFEDTKQMEGK